MSHKHAGCCDCDKCLGFQPSSFVGTTQQFSDFLACFLGIAATAGVVLATIWFVYG